MATISRYDWGTDYISVRVTGMSNTYASVRSFYWICTNGDSGWGDDAAAYSSVGGNITFSGLSSGTSYGFRVYIYNPSNTLISTLPSSSSYTYFSTDSAPSYDPWGTISVSVDDVDNADISASWGDQVDSNGTRWVYVFAGPESDGKYRCLYGAKTSGGAGSYRNQLYYVDPDLSGPTGVNVYLRYSNGAGNKQATAGSTYTYSGMTSYTTAIDSGYDYWTYSFALQYVANSNGRTVTNLPSTQSGTSRQVTKSFNIPQQYPSSASDSTYYYNFLGYSTNQYASTPDSGLSVADIQNGTTTSVRYDSTPKVLYCVWEAEPKATNWYLIEYRWGNNPPSSATSTVYYPDWYPSSSSYTQDPYHDFTIIGSPVSGGYEDDLNNMVRRTFAGWNTAANGTGVLYSAGDTKRLTSGDNVLVLYAQWLVSPLYQYKLLYDLNFAGKMDSEVGTSDGLFKIEYEPPSYYTTAVSATFSPISGSPSQRTYAKVRYTFSHWGAAADSATAITSKTVNYNDTVINGSTTYSPGGRVYAIWSTEDVYTVTFNKNGGDAGATVPATATLYSSTGSASYTVPLSPAPYKTGYTFLGWSTSSSATTASIQGGDTITLRISAGTQDIILYAVYKQNNSFSLTYNANAGVDNVTGMPSPNPDPYVGADDTHLFTVSSATPSRVGYEFQGWANSSSATTANIHAGDSVTANTTIPNPTIYAVWKIVYNYALAYNISQAGQGSPSPSPNPQTSASTDSSVDFALSTVVPTKTDYHFVGWCWDSDGSSTKYQGGATVTLYSSNPTRTIYAIMEPDWVDISLFTWTASESGDTAAIKTGEDIRSGLTALKWNALMDRVNEVRRADGYQEVSHTSQNVVQNNRIMAQNLINLIKWLSDNTYVPTGQSALPSLPDINQSTTEIKPGRRIFASYFNGSGSVKAFVNDFIQKVNDSHHPQN